VLPCGYKKAAVVADDVLRLLIKSVQRLHGTVKVKMLSFQLKRGEIHGLAYKGKPNKRE